MKNKLIQILLPPITI